MPVLRFTRVWGFAFRAWSRRKCALRDTEFIRLFSSVDVFYVYLYFIINQFVSTLIVPKAKSRSHGKSTSCSIVVWSWLLMW